MRVIESLRGRIYDLSAGKTTGDFQKELDKVKAKALKKTSEFQRRVELISGFDFPGSSTAIKVSPDGEFIAATGNYPPTVKMFETSQMGLKFARGLDANATNIEFLSTDYKKFCLLNDNKTVDIHARGGTHHTLKLPEYARDIKFVPTTAELLLPCDGGVLVRLDLEDGRYLESKRSAFMPQMECIASCPRLPICALGGTDGTVEIWDRRSDFKPINHTLLPGEPTITCLDFSPSGMELAVGADDGVVRIFDIRSSLPMCERDLMSASPVVDCKFLTHSLPGCPSVVVACDEYAVKVFSLGGHADVEDPIANPMLGREDDRTTLLASFNSDERLHQLCMYPGSGLMFAATDSPKMKVYFLPMLGLAPKWCSVLDGITEELQESETVTFFNDKRFVTKAELEDLGAQQMIGSLQPHMHGFMISTALYDKLRTTADPFKYEEYRKQKIQERIEKKRPMRLRSSAPKVNKALHEKLTKEKKHNKSKGSVLDDPRFAELFSNPEFTQQ